MKTNIIIIINFLYIFVEKNNMSKYINIKASDKLEQKIKRVQELNQLSWRACVIRLLNEKCDELLNQ